ncbi:dTDP-4-dehydrorhamnose 3,5-epimerase family protein [Polymorphobacter fuscus]|uniref:dTDP-4-dehydrorhamnose 3,5-epimerase n=1 Tax=Sandarakinorhabdus fusca TaxID=1439888 RepID=A0A7C9KIQ7_9SPHN|nr:dTDP-4-dehydrorhamnose 3,5-epimerase family protein [Polymorphobacter fuscus]KAB7646300.1 dTDP-4-keto-6-deoxy-D-glucose epimerase [Polymorphobacter fuscus]MQT17521.1 dTDP-4-dehydrorhamnose 3,5-epimerase [Polymorphobacter fuscus]NJC09940.1 dTDP-4-dehydrorhamnose 3,5-epimerase [Polymorphobacter fuscus]
MSRFQCIATPIEGVFVVERQRLGDSRGFLSRLFCAEELAQVGFTLPVAQINHTLTETSGTLRGLHFQHPPAAEDKLVSCLRGAVFDVAVDLRAGSPTFLHWHGVELSAENNRALMIPQGCAHGFQALVDGTELLYLHSRMYAPSAEGGLNPLDPRLAISWPLPATIMSPRDAGHQLVDAEFTGVST